LTCDYFGKCGSCTLYEHTYEKGLELKLKETKALFSDLYNGEYDIITSPTSNFRYRAEFRIWHEGDTINYAMNDINKKALPIKSCQIVSPAIHSLMPKLLKALKCDERLKTKLFAIEFLSTQMGDTLVTLIYHRRLEAEWSELAKELEIDFDIKIIGRSRGQKVVLSSEQVNEQLQIDTTYQYRFYENGFTQPNPKVNEQMISWVIEQLEEPKDLIELYCGAGNFTIPLSNHFEKVLATEISKISIKSAKENLELNGVDNVNFARLSAAEITQALHKERAFNRLKEIVLDEYEFSHIFVDPPRAGLDETSTKLVKDYDTILYISCNPVTLQRDLQELTKTHEIKRFAFFDQFAYTHHIESGVVLKRRD
jgi:tRNA (uracil-5-)-methyltransferase